MKLGGSGIAMWLAVVLALLGCAGGGPPGGGASGDASARRTGVKRIAIGINQEPDLHPTAIAPHHRFQPLVHSGLSILGEGGELRPVIAEAVPSLENGLWKLLPDGRMETTWHLRPEAQWHDGVPVTSDDLRFTLEVGQDPGVPGFQNVNFRSVEAVATPDAYTLTLSWKEPFVDADRLFGADRASRPLPRHRLGDVFQNNKPGFPDVPYWTQEYVGAGPYRIREWVPGTMLALVAHSGYALGRPRIDEIEVRIIPDRDTMSANLLSGAVDFTAVLSIDQGIQLRDQWRGGKVVFHLAPGAWATVYPQFVDPRPEVVADVRFRRALVHAMDRQAIVDTLVAGLSPVAHSFLSPDQPAYRDIESRIPRYEYDPRLAAQMLAELGSGRGADGIYRDAAGRRLEVELRSDNIVAKPADAISDYWQRVGVATTRVTTSPQQAQDLQWRAAFPAFLVTQVANDTLAFVSLHSSRVRLASNGFRAPAPPNYGRYMNPDLDALMERYQTTVPMPDRIQVIGEIVHHVADQVVAVGIYYPPAPVAVGERLVNFSPAGREIIWKAHEWDVKA